MTLTASDRLAGLHAALGLGPEPGAPRAGEQILAAILAEELVGGQPDLGRLVSRWIAVDNRPFACPVVARSLAELRRTGAPPVEAGFGPGLGAVVVTLVAAGRLFQTPRNLVSGVYHLARLLDPHPVGAFAAVAAGVAAGRLLDGKRDFVPEVLDVLLNNQAPDALVAEVRRAPVWARSGTPPAGPEAELGMVLWALHHFGPGPEVVQALEPLSPLGRLIGLALLGARHGPALLAREGHRAGGLESSPHVVEGPNG